MYQVVIKNGNEETIINAVSTDNEAPRLISGSIKHGINTIDNFTFTITPNNIGYNKLNSLSTLIEVLNTKNNKLEFRGRVLIPTEIMNDNGSLTKSVTCESELGYLMDSTTVYGEYHNISVRDFLQVIIDNHNSQVTEDKQFTLGNVTVQDDNDSLYRFLGYTKTLEAIKDKLIDRLGGELQIRYENGIRYLDYLESIGEVKDTEIRLSKNLQTIEQEKDPTAIISRLIPLGYKLGETDERLTVENSNEGSIYVDDPVAISKYGVIVNTVIWDDVTLSSNLLRKGKEFLKENNRIRKKYKISALDLSVIGLDVDNFEVGNSYRVINPIMGIDEKLRVIEKIIDINSPQNASLMIGDKFEDIKATNIEIKKKANAANEKANDNANKIKKVKIEIKETAEGLETKISDTEENLNSIISQTATDIMLKVNDADEKLQSQIDVNAENITSKVTKDDVSSIIKQDAESVKIGFNGINNNVVMSEDGLDINNGHFQLKNGNNVVLIDGKNNIHKIVAEGTAQINFIGKDITVAIEHGLGYKPAFSAYQNGANGTDEYTMLPAITWSDGVAAIIRARADTNKIYFDFKTKSDYQIENVTIYIKYFIYKEVAF